MQKFEDISKNNGSRTLFEVANSENTALDRRNIPGKAGIPNQMDKCLPGRFYGLSIRVNVPDLNERIVPTLNSGKPYYDISPVGLVLFHERWKEQVLILNLRVMPPFASAKLLEAYYKFSAQNGMTKLFKEGKLIPLEERTLFDQRFYLYTPSNLSQMVGLSNLNYAINKYNMDDVVNEKLIDFDNFGQLINPRIDRRFIFPENLDLADVYEQFLINSMKE